MNRMTPDAMRQALQKVRAGQLNDATALIQSTLTGNLNVKVPGVPS
jgi:hypothetical protein